MIVIIMACVFSSSVSANQRQLILNNDNYLKLESFLKGKEIYDIGLYTDFERALSIMKFKYPEFLELCEDDKTINNLRIFIEKEEDSTIKALLMYWYEHLSRNLSQIEGDINTQNIILSSNYINFTIRAPSGKIIPALKYIGTAVPPNNHPLISNFSTANKIENSSYFYNCHSYAWYFGGSINGVMQSELLAINDPYSFYSVAPRCSSTVATPAENDIAIYWDCPCLPNSTVPSHSAIITSAPSNNYNQITVKSKWGIYGVYTHRLSDCPYYNMALHAPISNPEGPKNCQGKILYYRISHQYTHYEFFNIGTHKVKCHACGGGSYTQHHNFYFSNGVYICSGCGYQTTSPVFPNLYDMEEI